MDAVRERMCERPNVVDMPQAPVVPAARRRARVVFLVFAAYVRSTGVGASHRDGSVCHAPEAPSV